MGTGFSYAAAKIIGAAQCNQESVYGSLKKRSMDPLQLVGKNGIVYRAYKALCGYMPYVMVLSIVFGILVFILAKKNKGLRRFGLYGLCIGIPLCALIFVFGFGAVSGIFLQ